MPIEWYAIKSFVEFENLMLGRPTPAVDATHVRRHEDAETLRLEVTKDAGADAAASEATGAGRAEAPGAQLPVTGRETGGLPRPRVAKGQKVPRVRRRKAQ